jgi:hypothetical protein
MKIHMVIMVIKLIRYIIMKADPTNGQILITTFDKILNQWFFLKYFSDLLDFNIVLNYDLPKNSSTVDTLHLRLCKLKPNKKCYVITLYSKDALKMVQEVLDFLKWNQQVCYCDPDN